MWFVASVEIISRGYISEIGLIIVSGVFFDGIEMPKTPNLPISQHFQDDYLVMQPNFTQCFKVSGIISYISMGIYLKLALFQFLGRLRGQRYLKFLICLFFTFSRRPAAFLITGGYVSILFFLEQIGVSLVFSFLGIS